MVTAQTQSAPPARPVSRRGDYVGILGVFFGVALGLTFYYVLRGGHHGYSTGAGAGAVIGAGLTGSAFASGLRAHFRLLRALASCPGARMSWTTLVGCKCFVPLTSSCDAAVDSVLAIAVTLPGARKVAVTNTAALLHIGSRRWFAWPGETVVVSLETTGSSTPLVGIWSRPRLWVGPIDFGANAGNTAQIVEGLCALVPKLTP